jgi:asparagine synthase (glutamine-hydrolysing)
MCGIAGILSTTTLNKPAVSGMVNGILHRGPDANGIFVDKTGMVALAHTRLSIIDLSTGANQPFYSADQRYVVVFNGEIYNFLQIREELSSCYGVSFKTHSDTEVIAEGFAVWREKVVDKLEGMFAIAILDQREHKVYLFRDRAGKKPLFYFQSDEIFAFASEIKSLLQHPVIRSQVMVNRNVIATFLHLGYIPEPATIYANIFKFPAAHYAVVDSNLNTSPKPYWTLQENIHPGEIKSPEDAKKQLALLLDKAVQERLIADVPLGAFLSGGTDSSLVSAVASRHTSAPLKTFSIGFKESKFDESKYARDVAKHLGTNHTEYILTEREAIDILEIYLRHYDEPFADTSAIPTMLVSKLARKEVKVILTGDGGDELFQGYGSYTWANRLANPLMKIAQRPLKLALQLSGKSRLERIAELLEPVKIGSIRSHIFSQEQYFFSQEEIRDQLLKDKSTFKAFEYTDSSLHKGKLTAGEEQALFDFQYYLKDDLLVKVDRASMYYALECRCPLLDHRIVEFAFSLHPSLKVRNGKAKWLLKELLRNYIPDALIDRPKWGFSVPLANWLKRDLRYLIDSYLSNETIESIGLFKPDYIRKLVTDFLAGKDYLYNRVWVLIVLHKWLKENQ